MKKKLLDILVCPACLPAEKRFTETVQNEHDDDIITGVLTCSC
jgi:uncharacterized protein YbaR (Trm112 family)